MAKDVFATLLASPGGHGEFDNHKAVLTMRECWLKPNQRALGIALVLPATLVLLGLALVFGVDSGSFVFASLGWTAVGLGLILLAVLVHFLRQPRLAYEAGSLLVFLQSARPIRVPIQIVEAFFFGQAPSQLQASDGQKTETSTVVVRLAEAEKDWHHRDVKPALGHWCDGYITIYGTWCEPLDAIVLKRLNERLVEVHRELRRGEATQQK